MRSAFMPSATFNHISVLTVLMRTAGHSNPMRLICNIAVD